MISFPARRAVLAGLASFAAQPARAQNPDVLIIGAGAAGIAAGHELKRRGISFQIIEARDRVGGRMFTDASLDVPFDAGAFYIHWAEKNPWARIARNLQAPVIADPLEIGPARMFRDGAPAAAALPIDSDAVTRALEKVSPRHDQSFADAVAGQPEAVRQRATMLAHAAFGEEPGRISAVDYQRLESGADLGLPDGYGALAVRHAAGLPVVFGAPVSAINWQGRSVQAVTGQGTISARAAIVTIPVAVLAAGSVRFTPALPLGVAEALHDIGAGASTRAALKFSGTRLGVKPFTRFADEGRAGGRISFTLWPYDRDIVTCWFGADYARDLARAGEAAALEHILDRFVTIAGPEARQAYAGGRAHFWWNDPFARGAYSLTRPGKADARLVLARSIGGRIWLAGEASSQRGALTAGGAYLAGQRAAREAAARVSA